MSGHSKWSKVKHQKATTDVIKGAAFTKAASAIIVAVRENGGITDPDKNFRLRLAIENARAVNMPKDTIERAIERGAGSSENAINSVTYEAYGPGGVGLLIDAATDNKQRTVAEVKNCLDRFGGTLATPGAVAYLFDRKGVIIVPKSGELTFDKILELAINTGADDVAEAGDVFEIYTGITQLHNIVAGLTGKGIAIEESAVIARPKTTIVLNPEKHEQLLRLTQQLDNLNDVLAIFTDED